MKLKYLRVTNDLTQSDIAKNIGITQFTYSNYENEKTQPDIETLKQLADYYGVSLDYLCEHETKTLSDLGPITDEQKKAIELLTQLDRNNLGIALGFLYRLKQEQNNGD